MYNYDLNFFQCILDEGCMCIVVVIVIIGDLVAFQRRDRTDTHVDLCRCGEKTTERVQAIINLENIMKIT